LNNSVENSEAQGSKSRETTEMVARRSYGKLVAFLSMRTRDVAAAEDALSEAFASALQDWPKNGCPESPEAWLLTVARRKVIDAARRWTTDETASEELLGIADALPAESEEEIPDRRLALMFVCAHPAIDATVRAPLILQAVLGLDAKVIGSAFLTSPAAMGKRLVRAKEKIRQTRIPFRIPERDELPARLGGVLDAIYAAYAEGWSDAGGTDAARRDLTEEALFLGRLVAALLPEEPEALGLLALILHSEARRKARRNPHGEYVPLAEQDVEQWEWSLIREAENLLRRAATMGTLGRYQLEAALQSAHVFRRQSGRASWADVVALYDALLGLTQSPVVALNRALAIAERDGAAAGLAVLPDETRLAEYQPYWAARAELHARTGASEEARRAYDLAIGLERNDVVRKFLQVRRDRLSLL
jgi:RNA polymerase sigma-70 factor (ECF subfamily)